MQRCFDIIFSGLAILILSPLFLILMFVLKFSGEGEIFFLQSRIGYKGKQFKLYKFATMLKDSPNIGTGTVTIKNDPRVLPIGGFLRKTKINELPQLFNIFVGDMSIIGPRPQTQRCFDAFSSMSKNQITKVRPGLSGIGSIVFRNEEEMMIGNKNINSFYDDVVMSYKGSLEEWYVSNNNFITYLSLILLTILILIGFSSNLIWKFFNDLPSPPEELNKWM